LPLPREIFGPSTASDWTATCIDDTVGPLTFPRAVSCSFATASSSLLTVGGTKLTITTVTSARSRAILSDDMRRSTRPVIERLPCLRLRDICKLIPRRDPNAVYHLDTYGWRYPGKVALSTHHIKITDAAIVPQCFPLAWVRTAGKPRPLIVCQCRRKAQVLYFYQGRYACKHCHRAQYVSERQSKAGKKLWKAAKKRIEINSIPSRRHSLSPKTKGKHRKKYARLVAEIQHLEQQATHSRIKDFDIKALAYHLR
jgi:hypothetical protein